MSRPTYTKRDVADALRAVGVEAGDIVFSHSNIGFFGLPESGRSIEHAFDTILGAFLDVLGPTGTLVVPTFTYSFPQGRVFDPDRSPSDCGAFTELLRMHPDSLRYADPCVSVAAIGGRAREMTANATENAYGPGSFFDRFYGAGGMICNLNFDAGSTFVHYVERRLQVPYRFDKTFEGVIERDGIATHAASTIWVRFLAEGTQARFESFDALARERGLFKTVRVGRGTVGAIRAQDTFDLIERTLPGRPWLLTRADVMDVAPDLAAALR
jgi:aminoglycoside 3-N-acetyltransferase